MEHLSEKTKQDIKKRTVLVTHPSGRKERVFYKGFPDIMDEHNQFRHEFDKEHTKNLRGIQLSEWDRVVHPKPLKQVKNYCKYIYYRYIGG